MDMNRHIKILQKELVFDCVFITITQNNCICILFDYHGIKPDSGKFNISHENLISNSSQ